MVNNDEDEVVYNFLEEIQLQQFFDKIHHVLHLTRLHHFDHVTEQDLSDINMSKPEQRRLFDALKRHKKDKKRSKFSLRRSRKKSNPTSPSTATSPKHGGQKSCLISENSLHLQEEIGNGSFGIVRKGLWTTNIGSKLHVAVKSVKYSNNEEFINEQNNFMREATSMSELDHRNVLHLYGIVLSSPLQLVMELAPLGSLLDRLKQEPQKFLISKLSDFVLQVASGMTYLESKRYVHRDLAARNLLLASYDKIKIGDFGLMRPLQTDDDIYVMNPLSKIPFAWCAPECLRTRQFSHASDVWAFGITVMEMFSYGKQPWQGLNATQILDLIDEPSCARPGKPDHCPDNIYSMLLDDCWPPKPNLRSKFLEIKQKMKRIMPEEITMVVHVDPEPNSVKLSARTGDIVTVITWKSRLGREFAKGQNQRTGEVGYFVTDQCSRTLTKTKDSKSPPRISKVKDISPPLDNSFSHIAHRSEGRALNWGPVMSDERQVLGEQIPLNLPTKLISLKDDNDEENEDDFLSDVISVDTCSINTFDTTSLSSRASSTHYGTLESTRSYADSGYYSNRNTTISSEYETMTGSRPILIPPSNQASYTVMTSGGVNMRRISNASSCSAGQRCRAGTSCSEGSPISACTEIRPALPPKQRVIVKSSTIPLRDTIGTDRDIIGDVYEDPYVNCDVIDENIYAIPRGPSCSPTAIYSNESFFLENIPYKGNQENDEIYSYPISPTVAKVQGKYCEFCDKDFCACSTKENRCHTFPDSQLKSVVAERKVRCKSESSLPNDTSIFEESLNDDIYENMDKYNRNYIEFQTNTRIPPPLPKKRRPLQRIHSEKTISHNETIYSVPRNHWSSSENFYQNTDDCEKDYENSPFENSTNLYQFLPPRANTDTPCKRVINSNSDSGNWEDNSKNVDADSRNSDSNDEYLFNVYEEPRFVKNDDGPWVLRNSNISPVDKHAYVEISGNLSRKLSHSSQDDPYAGKYGTGSNNVETFGEISNDFADLDLICDKLRNGQSDTSCVAEQKQLTHSKSVNQVNSYQTMCEKLERNKRFSADPDTLSRYTFTQQTNYPENSTQLCPTHSTSRTQLNLVTTV